MNLTHLSKRVFYAMIDLISIKWHLFVVNLTLVILGTYITFQKIFPFSTTELLSPYLPPKGVEAIKFLLILLIGYASVAKIIVFVGEAFPRASGKSGDPGKINSGILMINSEIKRHLISLNSESSLSPISLLTAHQFEVNVSTTASYMGDHIVGCFAGLGIKSRDIFISVYKVSGFEDPLCKPKSLEYVTHYPPGRDTVATKTIKLEDPKLQAYECVKAVRTAESIVLKFDCSDYAKSRNNRHKTTKHYIGFLLEADGKLLGFVTIEFHKHKFFESLDAMGEFLERDLFAFRSLIEYQFLKRRFFTQLANKPLLSNERKTI